MDNIYHRQSYRLVAVFCCVLLWLPLGASFPSHARRKHTKLPDILEPKQPAAERNGFTESARRWAVASVLGAAMLFGTPIIDPAVAVTQETTQIELNVETDYLLQVLEYFDGDIKRAIGAVLRSPFSEVRIDPPTQAREALLRALYSFQDPDDYATQASWLSVQGERSWIDDLTEKRYTLPLSGDGSPLTISQLDIGLTAAVLSYPISYAVYQYETNVEEQQAIAKRAKARAKKAEIAAKKTAAVAKTPNAKTVAPKANGEDGKTTRQSKGPKGAGSTNIESPSEIAARQPPSPNPKQSNISNTRTNDLPKQPAQAVNEVVVQSKPQALNLGKSQPSQTSNAGKSQQYTNTAENDGGIDAYAAAYAAMMKQQTSTEQPSISTAQAPVQNVSPLPKCEPDVQSFNSASPPKPQPFEIGISSQPSDAGITKRNSNTDADSDGGIDAYTAAYSAMMNHQTSSQLPRPPTPSIIPAQSSPYDYLSTSLTFDGEASAPDDANTEEAETITSVADIKSSMPMFWDWAQTSEGSIHGFISHSPNFEDGTYIITSPVEANAKGGTIVATVSGSKYYLSMDQNNYETVRVDDDQFDFKS